MFTTSRSRIKLLATIPVVLVIVWTVFNLFELLHYHGNILASGEPLIVGLSILFEACLMAATVGVLGVVYVGMTLETWVKNGK